MQIKTTMRYHVTPVRMDIIKKTIISLVENVGEKEPSNTVGENIKWFSHYV